MPVAPELVARERHTLAWRKWHRGHAPHDFVLVGGRRGDTVDHLAYIHPHHTCEPQLREAIIDLVERAPQTYEACEQALSLLESLHARYEEATLSVAVDRETRETYSRIGFVLHNLRLAVGP